MDQHFLIRYSFTGVVLLIFALAGLWITNDAAAVSLLKNFSGANAQSGTAIISAVATVPILGVMVHGVLLLYVYGSQGGSFPDLARKLIANAVRDKVNDAAFRFNSADLLKNYFAETEQSILYRKRNITLEPMPDDSIFVWLYYYDAPPHLIEWARRRRDYYYLGLNWALAAIFGLIFGLIVGANQAERLVRAGWKDAYVLLLMVLSLGWVIFAIFLGREMKRDVDSMELAWACGHLEPKLRDAFLPSTKNLDDVQETLIKKLSNSLNGGLPQAATNDFTAGFTQAASTLQQNLANGLTAGMNATAVALNNNAHELQSLAASLASGFNELSKAIASQQQALAEIAAKISETQKPDGSL